MSHLQQLQLLQQPPYQLLFEAQERRLLTPPGTAARPHGARWQLQGSCCRFQQPQEAQSPLAARQNVTINAQHHGTPYSIYGASCKRQSAHAGVMHTCLEGVGLIGHSFGAPLFFKKLLDCFAALANSIGLPRAIYATRIGLIQCRGSVNIKTDDESANAKWARASTLCVLLLDARNISSDVPVK